VVPCLCDFLTGESFGTPAHRLFFVCVYAVGQNTYGGGQPSFGGCRGCAMTMSSRATVLDTFAHLSFTGTWGKILCKESNRPLAGAVAVRFPHGEVVLDTCTPSLLHGMRLTGGHLTWANTEGAKRTTVVVPCLCNSLTGGSFGTPAHRLFFVCVYVVGQETYGESNRPLAGAVAVRFPHGEIVLDTCTRFSSRVLSAVAVTFLRERIWTPARCGPSSVHYTEAWALWSA